ncbi:polyphenol oxidase family protein [Candidatus Palauibacter sp.]|uniref:polyphenol oxidase family protein n=1 Tax=Candidatus Palauibacter sp. TaxID=3101350 RepID=UPI003AF2A1B1
MTPGRVAAGDTPEEIIGARALDGLEVEEVSREGVFRLTPWEALDPNIVCGITTAAGGDFGVAVSSPARVAEAYGTLARRLGFGRVSVPTQVHGTAIHEVPRRSGAESAEGAVPVVERAGRVDGQVTGARGCLLAATAADCAPIALWSRATGRMGLVHAGWRGAAAGILVRARLDLRGLLAGQALTAGVDRASISSSRHCTACGPIPLHSHRASGGKAGRMAAFLGRRTD